MLTKRLKRLIRCVQTAIFCALMAMHSNSSFAQEKVSLRLDWVNSGYHAIWYYGIDKGIFKAEGIDLEVLEGRGAAVTAQTVANGSVMFGTVTAGVSIGLIAQGLPIKIVSGYFRQSPMAFIFPKKNNWRTFADMKNARIGASSGTSAVLMSAVLRSTGLDGNVQIVNMEPSAKPAALLSGKVDAIESFDFLQVPLFESKGLEVATLPYAQAGVNEPGMSLVTTNELIAKNPALVRKMVRLMEKTIQASRNDPEGAVASLLKRTPTLDRSVQLKVLTLSFNLLNPDWAKGKPFGWLSPEIMEQAQEIFLKYGVIDRKLPVDAYFTNEFVPGA